MRRNGEWSDYVKGEWWISDSGSAYADQDIGEAGHESLAIDALVYQDILLTWLLLEEHLSDRDARLYAETGASSVISEYGYLIPDEVGARAISHETKDPLSVWRAILAGDARDQYSRLSGAVYAIDTDFSAWHVTDNTIKMIQEHLVELARSDDEPEDDDELSVNETSTQRYVTLPMKLFMLLSSSRELWEFARLQYQPNRRKPSTSRYARRR